MLVEETVLGKLRQYSGRGSQGSGPNYSSSTAPHHHWQKHSSIAALSKHINSAELKVIDFLRVSFFFSFGEKKVEGLLH